MQKDTGSLRCLISHTFKTTYSLYKYQSEYFNPTLLLKADAIRFLRVWISLRPISSSQLHALLHFHLCPIYLVFFKGSWDISS